MRPPLFSYKTLYRAWRQCRKNKGTSHSVLRFSLRAEEELKKLEAELQSRTYRPLPSVCFVARSPKPREVFAAHIRDRVVHHLLVGHLEKTWEKRFIFDSFACRKGKGTHAAVKRLQTFMRRASRNGSCRAYFLKIDIRSFFVSIHKETLCQMLEAKEPRSDVRWLIRQIVMHDPCERPIMRGPRRVHARIPKHKSLFSTQNLTGLPIGNYSSQFFANVYLNPLDQYIKHTLGCRGYLRYVDDLVLVSTDRAQLIAWERQIQQFLQSKLRLSLHPKRRVLSSVQSGCDFVGYIVRPSHLLVRRRSIGNLYHKLRSFEGELVRRRDGVEELRWPMPRVESLRATVASYRGQWQHASTAKLDATIWKKHPWLLFYFRKKRSKKYPKSTLPQLSLRLRKARFRHLAAQYYAFRRWFPNMLHCVEVGCFFELFGADARAAMKGLGLRRLPERKRLGPRCGFPRRQLGARLPALRRLGRAVLVLRQHEGWSGRVRRRQPWRASSALP